MSQEALEVCGLVMAAAGLDPELTTRDLAVHAFEVYTAGEPRWRLAWRILRGSL